MVEAEGLHAVPAFFDPHVHLRTPGREDKEDIETGTRAAAAGGYCGVLAMANTEPPVVTPAAIESLRERAGTDACLPTGFLATVTRGMRGDELTDMAELADVGRRRVLRRRPADPERPGDAPRAPVPGAGRAPDRSPRGGPRALRQAA